MRDRFAVGTEVALLIENDLIDEAAQAWIALGCPGYVDAGEADLERFEQRFRALDARKKPMRNESPL